MKMTRRSPDEQLRPAADCLSRLRGLGPDLLPKPRGKHGLQVCTETIFNAGPGPVLAPVGGAFQPPLETGYPGGGAYHILGSFFICVLKNSIDNRIDSLYSCEFN